jgi:hypothetical protein
VVDRGESESERVDAIVGDGAPYLPVRKGTSGMNIESEQLQGEHDAGLEREGRRPQRMRAADGDTESGFFGTRIALRWLAVRAREGGEASVGRIGSGQGRDCFAGWRVAGRAAAEAEFAYWTKLRIPSHVMRDRLTGYLLMGW